MKAGDVKVVGTIDLTPTWEETAGIISMILQNGNYDGIKAAEAELFRMARLADAYVAQSKGDLK
ncbi:MULTISPECIES: hypothetical protein [unclassified Sphingomonas]|uniref:hypothetical protein n=1 Tax=unclassified Sphingomonas TaxID=196159 RepID=UPI0021515E11|nr:MULTISPECIES: hypothetical protein [unclassified Sphingomonas]MCR5870665.1 hypothetical protein [Sphingomonas sp. J344]UUY00997.1 hypothetical protein LRS08_08060 [Sphingomonas sp. J315]